jgi:hypothetical protein
MLCKSGMETSPKKLLPLTLFAIAVTSLFSVRPAQAFTITLEQMGSNVVATGSGAFNLTGLNSVGSGLVANVGITPSLHQINMVAGLSSVYTGFTGPSSFGAGGGFLGSSSSGNVFSITGGYFFLPFGYVSGTALSNSMTFNNANFASLGVTSGTYVWSWGTGLRNQNFTLQIGPAGVPDGGSTVTLLGCGLLGLAGLRRRLSC